MSRRQYSDGLLEMVKGGYGATTDSAPPPLRRSLSAAEQEAIVERRGLWSPAEREEAFARVSEEQARRREVIRKEKEDKDFKDQMRKLMNTSILVTSIKNETKSILETSSNYEPIERGKRDDRIRPSPPRTPTPPEFDAGPAAGAFALLICSLLMLTDRRRARWVGR